MSTSVLTIEAVKKHNTEVDCYVIVYKKVYDASKVTSEKMEGFEKVLEFAGTDATSIYDSLPSSTRDAMTLLGDLSESQISGEAIEESKNTEANVEEGTNTEEKPKESLADKKAGEMEQKKKAQETEKAEASTPRKGKMSKKCVCM
jgi:hypothetical protein